MKIFTSDSQKIGLLGEDVACKFLMKQGYSILERNYTKKWGEIDIIATKSDELYFVEVKSKQVETVDLVDRASADTTRSDFAKSETNRPEDNMHAWKLKRLARTVQTYLIHNRIGNTPWQFDLLVVYLDIKNRKARVRVVENVIL